MLVRFDPLSTKNVVMLGFVGWLLISAIAVRKDVVFEFRDEEGFAVQDERVASLSSRENVVDGAGSVILVDVLEF